MPTACYYDTLKVERTANDSEIKSAYRKLALQWHPDKNVGNEEEAHRQFQIIQEAYNVLSDPHERTWYDNHREQILNGGATEDDSFNVFPYFTASCYKGFDDDNDGFYAVYRKVFATIAEEDEAAVGRGKHSAPDFGNSRSSYEEVVEPFYNYWSCYSTKKTYSFMDQYVPKEVGRKVGKLVERDNKKQRQKLKKERNDLIRDLVKFVKKRDKRVIEYSKEMQLERERKKERAEELRKEQIRQNVQKREMYQESNWAKFSNLEEALNEAEKEVMKSFNDKSSDDSSDDEESPKSFYCVACKKLFQSEKAFANHERSKKHKENLVVK